MPLIQKESANVVDGTWMSPTWRYCPFFIRMPKSSKLKREHHKFYYNKNAIIIYEPYCKSD
jgi:hypothetical protein